MQNAPPVVFPVGRFAWGWAWLALWSAMGALGLVAWQNMSAASNGRVVQAWLVWGVCLACALWSWPREQMQGGQLTWSGEQWYWRDAEGAETSLLIELLLDLGTDMWVRMRPDGPADWRAPRIVWLHRPQMPRNWHGLRCAVYSRPQTPDKPMNFVQDV